MRVKLSLSAILLAATLLCMAGQAAAQRVTVQDRFLTSSDGVRLHYLEAGPPTAHTIVFIPGWTMPAWIWTPQIQAFGRHYHVVAFDPRGQGLSDVPSGGYEPFRRGKDIAEVVTRLGPGPVVIVAWSLGVLDTLAYVHTYGDRLLAGLVLVDNSVGEEPPPTAHPPPRRVGPPPSHAESVRLFVRSMFHRSPGEAYLQRLTHAAMRTPEQASKALLSYPLPRSYWRDAVYSTNRPLLYVVRPVWSAQAYNLTRNRPGTEMEVFAEAGHALFVDEPARFNALLESFIRRRIWP
ncbi:MAG TPA: alpha/beta hydrolase [Acetobacteraceae bacterium]